MFNSTCYLPFLCEAQFLKIVNKVKTNNLVHYVLKYLHVITSAINLSNYIYNYSVDPSLTL